ncbi:MAG: hypothetical protein CMM44_04045 [Rhodospirillaceae bacterium]|nr:hypothetical protein [Rhodospirillaceae bacterium]
MPNTKLIILFLVALIWFCMSKAIAAELSSNPSFWSNVVSWIFDQQRAFHKELIVSIQNIKNKSSYTASISLISLSFLYGIFHAAGPGHGKAVITSYLATQPEKRVSAILLATGSSLIQGITALIIVYGLIFVAGFLPRDASDAISWSERASFLLVMILGVILIIKSLQSWKNDYQNTGNDMCSHVHGPTKVQIRASRNILTTLSIILSIGLRPCTGAVVVLVFAQALGLYFAGIIAVLMMALGTGITVSGLAFFVVSVRSWISTSFTRTYKIWDKTGNIISITGGVFLVVFGISLLSASWKTAHPMF